MSDIETRLKAIATAQHTNIRQLLKDHHLDEYYGDDDYDEWLDEINGKIQIAGVEYQPSQILHSTDPIHYRCEYSSWIDREAQAGILTWLEATREYYKTEQLEELLDQFETEEAKA